MSRTYLAHYELASEFIYCYHHYSLAGSGHCASCTSCTLLYQHVLIEFGPSFDHLTKCPALPCPALPCPALPCPHCELQNRYCLQQLFCSSGL